MKFRFFLLSVTLYLSGVIVLLLTVLKANGGHFEYAVDDAYIHMAVAKNFVLHGVFGITRYGFTSSLSSILWPWLLIGGFKLIGPNEYVPLVLNVLLSLGTVAFAFAVLDGHRALLFSLSAVLLASTLSLTFTGLEHNLHVLSTLLLFSLAVGIFGKGSWERPLLFVAALLTTGARYEGMAAVLILSLYRLLKGDLPSALLILTGGALPVVAYGVWSEAHGWYFLPTSVLTKAYRFNLHTPVGWADLLFLKALRTSLTMPALYSLWLLLLLLLATPLSRGEARPSVLLALLIYTAHLYFGNVHWFYRYEAYIVALALFVVAHSLNWEYVRRVWRGASPLRRVSLLLLSLVWLSPVLSRGYMAVAYVPSASNEVYRQDYQMARFAKEYYGEGTVVLNDVGNVAFYTDARIIDLWGLATLETAKMMLEGRYTWENVRKFAEENGGEVAILYGDVFAERYFPIRWEEVGLWYLVGPRRFVVGNKAVYFYAVKEDPDTLRLRFEAFSEGELPPGVYWEVLTPSP